jgi:negative regulator of sigma E activity
MNEQEQISQLSALFDNELPPAQSGMVIRRALKDPALRASWGNYALIGACMRGEPLHAGRLPDVAERVRLSLAAEADHAAAAMPAAASDGAQRSWYARHGRGVLGGAIAASVAIVSLVVVRSVSPPTTGPAAQLAQANVPAAAVSQPQVAAADTRLPAPVQAAPLLVARDGAPPSYTTPVDNSPASRRISGPLVNYVVAHSDIATSASLSTLVSTSYDPTLGAVEMTPDQVGARR